MRSLMIKLDGFYICDGAVVRVEAAIHESGKTQYRVYEQESGAAFLVTARQLTRPATVVEVDHNTVY